MLIRYGDDPQLSQFGLLCNTEDAGLFSNVSSALDRGLPELQFFKGVPAVVCGGGPSIAGSLEKILQLQAAGAKVFALNGTAKYLCGKGIKPDYHILVDPRPENIDFVEDSWATEVLLASQCHPSLFDQCQKLGQKVTVWHPAIPGIEEKVIGKDGVKPLFIGGGLTVGLSGLCVIYTMGHREFHLFGYDSSHSEAKSHAYEQDRNKNDEIVRCTVDSKVFYCSMAMAGQANAFKETTDMLIGSGCSFHVYGEGLVPTLWSLWEREKSEKHLTAVYDLGVSPPTYEFLGFLIAAERERIQKGFDRLDIVIQPGPMHGFRDDELPPDVEARKGMLWRVVVPMARLLPSVRNVEVLGRRRTIEGDVFPEGYAENSPKSCYGVHTMLNASRILKASESALRHVAHLPKFATITLRQSSYWPERNSNVDAWCEVADWLWSNGIWPVFIPDTEGECPQDWGHFEAAAFDIDLRSALYEKAEINLGVSNGPTALMAFLGARYLIFKFGGGAGNCYADTKEFLEAQGFKEGDSFGGNGKLLSVQDTAENILAELGEFAVKQTEQTS